MAWFYICFLQYSIGKHSAVGTINLFSYQMGGGLYTLLSKYLDFILVCTL